MTWHANVVVGLQLSLVVTLLEGVRRRETTAAANSLLALVLALLPAGIERAYGIGLGVELPLWVAAAGLLHAFGMLGLYESTRWWDHLTHTVSAALVAALVYAGAIGVGGYAPVVAAGSTLLVTFLVGVGWELLELVARDVSRSIGIGPLLIPYGRRDAALDLVFDVGGAALVVVADVRVFLPVVDQLVRLVG